LEVNASGDIFAGVWNEGVFRSSDNGDSWTPINTGLTNPFIEAININSSGDILAGTNGGVFRSTNNGDNWTKIQSEQVIYAIATSSANAIFAGSWGNGIFRSIDNGNNWTEINSGITYTRINVLAINSFDEIIAGSTYFGGGGVFRTADNGGDWTEVYQGLSVYDLVVNMSNDIFFGTTCCGIFRSTDNGYSWDEVNNGLANTYIRSLLIDSSNNILAGIQNGLYCSYDNGDNWTEVGNGLPPNTNIYTFICSSGGIFAGTNNGIFFSSDTGNNWTETNNGLSSYTTANSFIFNSSGDIFAGTNNGIYRSTDNGNNWIEVNNGLLNTYITALAVDTLGNIYSGTSGGVYRSRDNGDSWAPINDGLFNTNVQALASDSVGKIFAGTFGGGVFRLMEPTDVSDDEDNYLIADDLSLSQNYPNPFNPSTTIEYTLQSRSKVTITVFDILGRKVKTIFDQTMSAGTHSVTWDGTDIDNNPVATGVYFYQIKADDFVESKKMLLLK